MTGTSTNLNSNISDRSPKGSEIATAVTSPAAVVAPLSHPSLMEVLSATSAALGLPRSVPPVGLGAADFSGSAELLECDEQQASEQHAEACHGDCKVAFGSFDFVTHDTPINSAPLLVADELIKAFGISHELFACHFGIPCEANSVVENTVLARQPSVGVSSLDLAAVSSGIAAPSTRFSIMNVSTFLVAAASEIISNSKSSVEA